MAQYDKTKHGSLKFNFDASRKIDKNYSQAYQDMFVLTMLNGKRKGTYLEIGAYDPTSISNTYLLEKNYRWRGVSIDIEEHLVKDFKRKRRNQFVLSDALALDYEALLIKNRFDKQIDYLSIDIEPKTQTLECLKKLPLDKYRFSVITYETDYYDDSEGREAAERVRKESRQVLTSHGYLMIVGNIANLGPNDVFEDWYVDPQVIDPKIIEIFKFAGDFNDAAEKYMLAE